jgi:hypothetical protein
MDYIKTLFDFSEKGIVYIYFGFFVNKNVFLFYKNYKKQVTLFWMQLNLCERQF